MKFVWTVVRSVGRLSLRRGCTSVCARRSTSTRSRCRSPACRPTVSTSPRRCGTPSRPPATSSRPGRWRHRTHPNPRADAARFLIGERSSYNFTVGVISSKYCLSGWQRLPNFRLRTYEELGKNVIIVCQYVDDQLARLVVLLIAYILIYKKNTDGALFFFLLNILPVVGVSNLALHPERFLTPA